MVEDGVSSACSRASTPDLLADCTLIKLSEPLPCALLCYAQVEVNLDAGGSEDAEPPLVDGTAAPGVSGLRLAQLWISKPFYPLFTNKQVGWQPVCGQHHM